MKCPDCEKIGAKSQVLIGTTVATAIVISRSPRFVIELCSDDPNTYTTSYSCSNGHSWTKTNRQNKVGQQKAIMQTSTEIDFDSLKAGPGLNALIERVVLKLSEICNGQGRFHGGYAQPYGYWCEGCAADDENETFYSPHPRVPYDYSGDIAFAWRLIEKFYPRFGVEPHDIYPWVCHDGGGDINCAKVVAFAETAPLAICIAVLEATLAPYEEPHADQG